MEAKRLESCNKILADASLKEIVFALISLADKSVSSFEEDPDLTFKKDVQFWELRDYVEKNFDDLLQAEFRRLKAEEYEDE